MRDRIVLGYSGGLDTTVMIKWISEKLKADVVTLTVDVGQNEDLKAVEERAYSAGAVKHHTVDCRTEFVKEYVFPAVKANGLYENVYPLSTALARPLIAKKLVELARVEGATGVAHGCTGKGNDQIRFEVTIRALDPELEVHAPVRTWGLSRDEELEYARLHKLPVSTKSSVYSIDQNLWGRSVEGGPLENLNSPVPEDALEWVKPVQDAPDEPLELEFEFKTGVPVRVDGVSDPVAFVELVNKAAGAHGFGLIDHLEDRVVGIKSREVYEVPAALAIIKAHEELESLTLTRHQLEFKRMAEARWAWLVYSGLWVDPLKADLDHLFDSSQESVEGTVRLRIHKGVLSVVSRDSPHSLYSQRTSTYSSASDFDQSASEGFIKVWGMSSIHAHKVREGLKIEPAQK